MTLTARRLALFVLGAAILAVLVHEALSFVLFVRDDDTPFPRLEIGFVRNLIYLVTLALWPTLLLVAGILALRRRLVTRAEVVLLFVIAGLLVAMVLVGVFESVIEPWSRFVEFNDVSSVPLAVAPVLGAGMVLAILALLIGVIVQTIRAPRPSASRRAVQDEAATRSV